MKYMIMMFGSQQDYDSITGARADSPWTDADLTKLHEFMTDWNQALVDSGEFVDGQGLAAPSETRRIRVLNGAPVVTDGPYAETQEVLAGYTIVDCASVDRAVEIAGLLKDTPHPATAVLAREWYVDVRPIAGAPEFVE